MKDYEEWKKDYLAGSDTRKYLVEKQLREEFEKQFGTEASLGTGSNVSHSASKSSLDEPKHSLSEKAAELVPSDCTQRKIKIKLSMLDKYNDKMMKHLLRQELRVRRVQLARGKVRVS